MGLVRPNQGCGNPLNHFVAVLLLINEESLVQIRFSLGEAALLLAQRLGADSRIKQSEVRIK